MGERCWQILGFLFSCNPNMNILLITQKQSTELTQLMCKFSHVKYHRATKTDGFVEDISLEILNLKRWWLSICSRCLFPFKLIYFLTEEKIKHGLSFQEELSVREKIRAICFLDCWMLEEFQDRWKWAIDKCTMSFVSKWKTISFGFMHNTIVVVHASILHWDTASNIQPRWCLSLRMNYLIAAVPFRETKCNFPGRYWKGCWG